MKIRDIDPTIYREGYDFAIQEGYSAEEIDSMADKEILLMYDWSQWVNGKLALPESMEIINEKGERELKHFDAVYYGESYEDVVRREENILNEQIDGE